MTKSLGSEVIEMSQTANCITMSTLHERIENAMEAQRVRCLALSGGNEVMKAAATSKAEGALAKLRSSPAETITYTSSTDIPSNVCDALQELQKVSG